MMRNKAAQSNPGILELKNNYENSISRGFSVSPGASVIMKGQVDIKN